MAQQQRAQGPSDPEAAGVGMSDAPETWGNGGLVGDGRYRLTHRLGRGGMAEVFAAEDVRLGRTVAVKLLRTDLAEDPTAKARFTREAQSVAGLNHHSIVAVYDSGEDMVGGNSVPYIVMELVEGRTIRELLSEAEAPGPEQALIIVSGVLDALAYSHQHGIVHRDIKPANVIITHNGAVKVMDFGIARALHGASSTMTQTGMVMGTPQYLSPEQALGKAVDHRSDLYATGCLLYELLALRPPFTGETPLSVVYQHVQDAPMPPSEVSDAVPPELDGLVLRALAKDPDDRFQTAEEMSGLVQYGLQMLYEHGPFTGTWNTGPVDGHDGRRTPPAGMAATTAMQHPGGSGTAQIPKPMIPSYADRNDGGHGYDGQGGRPGGGGRNKLWLLAALAVVAVVAGVALALNGDGNGGNGGDGPSPTATTSQKPKDDGQPSTDPSQEPTDQATQDQGNENGDGQGWGDNPTPSYSPSYTEQPTDGTQPSAGTGDGQDGGDASQPPQSTPVTSDPATGDPGTGTGGTSGTGGGDDPANGDASPSSGAGPGSFTGR